MKTKEPSRIFLNAKKQADEVGITFERLERSIIKNGTMAHFKTQVKGEKIVYHYGYYSIFEAIKAEKDRQNGVVVQDEESDENFDEEVYEFEANNNDKEHHYI